MTADLRPPRTAVGEQGAAPSSPAVRRGRGRPPALTSPERIAQLLADIRAGATVAEAAAAAGLSRTPVYNLRRDNASFAQALAQAQQEGKAARRAAGPQRQVDQHGTEARYTKRRCPCKRCRDAGSRARARRRAPEADAAPNTPVATAA
ncbi:hypothetical protein ACFUIW_33950 [Streptomyces sp. NPDC057245]|uniref:hypothetical protein n=1 Tax=Streptomyces sp. NPDC057245 TaxID=3346065 RepID=UPI003642896A